MVVFNLAGISYAHNISIKNLEEDVVQVVYADGTVSAGAEITVYDEHENKLLEGSVDQKGNFDYSGLPQAALIVARDSMGHHNEWEIGAESSGIIINPLIVLLVVLTFCLAAAVFYYKQQEKNK